MRTNRIWAAASAASGITLALALAACSGSSYSSGSKPAATSSVFTYDTYTQVMIDGWDPATEYSNGIIAMSNMYQTLTHYNPVTHQVDPLLATSWTHSANGLTWTFQLRHGVYFHTGRLMTAPSRMSPADRKQEVPRWRSTRMSPGSPRARTWPRW